KRKVIAIKGYQSEDWGGRALNALEALKMIPSQQLEDFEVVIYSAGEDVRQRAESLAQGFGIKLSILPRSHSQEMVRLMGRARVAIGIGLADGTPVSMLEAMIMGALPIQSDTVSIAEWIHDGENGLLVPPDQPEVIARAIQRALTDDNLVEQAARINADIAAERLDQDVIQPRVIEIYKKIAK